LKKIERSDVGKIIRAMSFHLRDYFTLQALADFNRILTECLLEKARGRKKIGVQLTAGGDTRMILSVLLRHGVEIKNTITKIPPQIGSHNKDDVKIAATISKDFGLDHLIVPEKEYMRAFENFDIIYSGDLVSNYAGFFFYANRLDSDLVERLNRYGRYSEHCGFFYVPMTNPRLITVLMRTPFYLRMNRRINKYVIKKNMPSLLNYPFSRS